MRKRIIGHASGDGAAVEPGWMEPEVPAKPQQDQDKGKRSADLGEVRHRM